MTERTLVLILISIWYLSSTIYIPKHSINVRILWDIFWCTNQILFFSNWFWNGITHTHILMNRLKGFHIYLRKHNIFKIFFWFHFASHSCSLLTPSRVQLRSQQACDLQQTAVFVQCFIRSPQTLTIQKRFLFSSSIAESLLPGAVRT